ncbi:MAG: phosphatidylserine/phosphatidylglycerophosphate/cardiolipin synthase family protein [Sphingomonadaceae bacterium]
MTESKADNFAIGEATLTLHVTGAERLGALLALIGGAQSSLRLFYYIFAQDEAGRQVRDAMIAACGRGVNVSLTIDGFGSSATDAFLAPLQAAGADVCRFLPRLGRRYLLRNHQKMALADDNRALIGGFNVANDYFSDSGPTHWRDLGLSVEGSPVHKLAGYYDSLAAWSRKSGARLRHLRRALGRWSDQEGQLRWLMGGPTRRLNPWTRAIRNDLKSVRALELISAYFVPSPFMLGRIAGVSRRGGDVNVLTAAKSDNDITIAAARHSYHRLLKHGVKVWEYRAARLHTKLLILDDVVYLGSANFDMRSLYLNLEIMLRIEDKGFADHMRAYAENERVLAQAITPALHRRRRARWFARLRWSIAYFLVGVLDNSVSRRLNFGRSWK